MKDWVQIAKDMLAAAKDAVLVVLVLAVIFFPSDVKWFLREKIGFTSINTAIGTLSLVEQVREGAVALTSLEEVRRSVAPDSAAGRALDTAVHAIQSATGRAQQSAAVTQPLAVPNGGWIYLGTVDPARQHWKPGLPGRTTVTISEPYGSGLQGTAVLLRTDVNLREARPLPEGELPRVVGVARGGQRVRLLEVDASRPAERDSPDAPGFRVFARVELPPAN